MATVTHTWAGSDITPNNSEYFVLVGSVLHARHLGDFTGSDLSSFVPMTIGGSKTIWSCGSCYYDNILPSTGDVPADGSGYLTMPVVTNGWYSFFREFKEALWLGDNVSTQTANGLYLDVWVDSQTDLAGRDKWHD